MSPQLPNLPLLREHQHQQRTTTLNLIADEMCRKGATEHTIRTALTGINSSSRY